MSAAKGPQTGLAAAVVSMVALVGSAGAQSPGITCDFSDPGALSRLYAQARDSRALWTKSNGMGGFAACSQPYEAGCRQWVQNGPLMLFPPPGQYARLRVESVTSPKFHLEFEDPSIGYPGPQCRTTATPDDGLGLGYGRLVAGSCIPADWDHEPRWLETRNVNPVISVWVEGMRSLGPLLQFRWTSTGPRLFDLVSFNNRGWKNITLQVKWYDGNWYEWPDLGRGVHDVSWWAYWILEARFVSEGPIRLDDIVTANIQLD